MKKILFIIFIISILISCDKPVEEPIKEIKKKKPEPVYSYIRDSFEEGESFINILKDNNIPKGAAYKLANKLNEIYDLKYTHPKDSVIVKLDSLNEVVKLTYKPDLIHNYNVVRDSFNQYYTSIDTLPVIKKVVVAEGVIESSLWNAMQAMDEKPSLIMNFTQIFQWDIDFFVDPQKGDKFKILFEKYLYNGHFIKYGSILAAKYKMKGYDKTAYKFKNKKGFTRYYDKHGKAFQKAFLKSPLNYTRISSFFSRNRYHPILKKVRTHNGVDYAAPYGTPVEAAADGTVIHRGWKGGYGKTVMIRHANGYKTLYGHLSKYGRYRVGRRVKQHNVIGYVGSTGLSTGNHLHYTVYMHDKAINPLKMKNVSGPPVPKTKMTAFRAIVDSFDTLMQQEPISTVIAREDTLKKSEKKVEEKGNQTLYLYLWFIFLIALLVVFLFIVKFITNKLRK